MGIYFFFGVGTYFWKRDFCLFVCLSRFWVVCFAFLVVISRFFWVMSRFWGCFRAMRRLIRAQREFCSWLFFPRGREQNREFPLCLGSARKNRPGVGYTPASRTLVSP